MQEINVTRATAGNNFNVKISQSFSKLCIVKTQDELTDEKRKYLQKMWNVPQRNSKFTGRKEKLKELKTRLQVLPGEKLKPVVITACHGLGGVGKTQLATEFIYQNTENYQVICWIPADNENNIESAYLELAQDLNIAPENAKPEEIIDIVKNYLSSSGKCLLIYDNASNFKVLEKYLPSIGAEVLITSRYSVWDKMGMELDIFEMDEAREYIEKILGKREIDKSEIVDELIVLLGRLPLALAQAAAYIGQNKMRIEDYLELYKNRKKYLLENETMPVGDKHEAVYVTWDITVGTIKEKSMLALNLINICAYLYNASIPDFLLRTFSEIEENNPRNEVFEESLSVLNNYSMVSINGNNFTASIHQLVQDVTRSKLAIEARKKYLEKVKELLLKENPVGQQLSDYSKKRLLLLHLERLISLCDESPGDVPVDTSDKTPFLMSVLNSLGDDYDGLGDVKKAKTAFERLITVKRGFYGDGHSEVARSMGTLSKAYGELGNTEKERTLLEEALVIFTKNEGHQSLGVAKTLMNLGLVWGKMGNAQRQKELAEQALLIFESNFNSMDPEIAIPLNILADAYGELGDVAKRKELLERALKIRETAYGSDHPLVNITLTSLGNACFALGDLTGQMTMLKRALAIAENFYGKDHVGITSALGNLATAYLTLKKFSEAKAQLERSLKISEEHYGKEHVEIAKILDNLSIAYNEEPLKQKELLERALPILEMRYGPNHPEVAINLNNLGSVYGELNELPKSLQLLERAQAILEANYGAENIKVAICLNAVAIIYGKQRNIQKQKEVFERIIKIKKSFYGPKHYEVGFSLYNLAITFLNLSDFSNVVKYAKEAHQIFVEDPNFGPQHGVTQKINGLLGLMYQKFPMLFFSTTGLDQQIQNKQDKVFRKG